MTSDFPAMKSYSTAVATQWMSLTRLLVFLELLSATFVVQTFVKEYSEIAVLLKLNNISTAAYIDNLGGKISPHLVALAKNLWMLCLERNLHIITQHLPGMLNHASSRYRDSRNVDTDWIHGFISVSFMIIDRLLGPVEVDLFASRITIQCSIHTNGCQTIMQQKPMHSSRIGPAARALQTYHGA